MILNFILVPNLLNYIIIPYSIHFTINLTDYLILIYIIEVYQLLWTRTMIKYHLHPSLCLNQL